MGNAHAQASPVDIYYASWRPAPKPPLVARDIFIGYFYFIENGFRWDSLVRTPNNSLYRANPIYPYPAEAGHPSGLVFLAFNVRSDGTVSSRDISVVPTARSTQDPALIKAATDAIVQWRYLPPALAPLSGSTTTERIFVAPPGVEEPKQAPPRIVVQKRPPS
jgi:hypothetical protein